MDQVKRICIGKITGAHGVRGAVRVQSFTEDPDDLFTYAPVTDEAGARTFKMTPKGVIKDNYIVEIDDVTDRDVALALRGVRLYVARDALPATNGSEYYIADLLGLQARDADTGETLGKVSEAHDYGAGIFLEIKPEGAASFMVPFRDAFVPTVDVAGGYLTVRLPTETLEGEDDAADLDATP